MGVVIKMTKFFPNGSAVTIRDKKVWGDHRGPEVWTVNSSRRINREEQKHLASVWEQAQEAQGKKVRRIAGQRLYEVQREGCRTEVFGYQLAAAKMRL